MTRLGTCRYAYLTQESYRISHVHGGLARVSIDDSIPDNWQCAWLTRTVRDVPPPMARLAVPLRAGDCDSCSLYGPPNITIRQVAER